MAIAGRTRPYSRSAEDAEEKTEGTEETRPSPPAADATVIVIPAKAGIQGSQTEPGFRLSPE
jgi:hypothetical protein